MITLTDAPAAKAEKGSDSSHWYQFENDAWTPLYEPGKSFTLREARKLKAAGKVVVPSVTTVFRVMHKQNLVDWKIEQALKVAARSPYDERLDTIESWTERLAAQADGSSRGAADLGTRIHAAIENAVKGEDYEAECQAYVAPTLAVRKQLGVKLVAAEMCVGSPRMGYAGRCDEHYEGLVVGDFKSRKTRPGRKVPTYETDAIQLAAYGWAIWGDQFLVSGRGIIYVISTSEAGRVEAVHFETGELRQAFVAFCDLCGVWRYLNNFDPRT